MSNATLFFRSVLIVGFIAGIPHALAWFTDGYTNKPAGMEMLSPGESVQDESQPEDWSYYWQGRYTVTFEGMDEKAIYEIRKEGDLLKCYAVAFIDANGNRYEDNSLLMKALNIDEYQATADYSIEYEGEQYEVKSKLIMDEDGNLELTYEYEGYKGRESWKRMQ